jgi:hypothetical protein
MEALLEFILREPAGQPNRKALVGDFDRRAREGLSDGQDVLEHPVVEASIGTGIAVGADGDAPVLILVELPKPVGQLDLGRDGKGT